MFKRHTFPTLEIFIVLEYLYNKKDVSKVRNACLGFFWFLIALFFVHYQFHGTS